MRPVNNNQNQKLDDNDDGFHTFMETPSIKATLDVLSNVSSELFQEPRKAMNRVVQKVHVEVEESIDQPLISAIHNRFFDNSTSVDEIDNDDDDEASLFHRSRP